MTKINCDTCGFSLSENPLYVYKLDPYIYDGKSYNLCESCRFQLKKIQKDIVHKATINFLESGE